MMHAIRPFMALALILSSSISRAEELTIYIAEMSVKSLSVEMVVGARLDPDDGQENIGIVYYSLGKEVGSVEVDLEHGDLKGELEVAREEPADGPFFRECDSYIVKDSKGKWFLMQYEFDPGERYRFCPLSPLSKRETLFLANGYLYSSFGALSTEFAKLTKSPANLERRKRLVEMLAWPQDSTDGEQDGAEQPATAPESKSEGSEKPKPESEGRSQ